MTPRRLKDHNHVWNYMSSSDGTVNGYDRFECIGKRLDSSNAFEHCIAISIPASLVYYLRSLEPLPKPREPEPLNIGAIITDGTINGLPENAMFVRIDIPDPRFYHFTNDWMLVGGNPSGRGNYRWDEFKNPHVLSEGYVDGN